MSAKGGKEARERGKGKGGRGGKALLCLITRKGKWREGGREFGGGDARTKEQSRVERQTEWRWGEGRDYFIFGRADYACIHKVGDVLFVKGMGREGSREFYRVRPPRDAQVALRKKNLKTFRRMENLEIPTGR